MTMRDLTVRNDAYLPTVGWTHGGFGIRALAALLWFEGNDLSGRERAVFVVHDQSGRTPLGPSTILVVDNRLRTLGDADAVAVRATDAGETPTQFVIVERNVLEIDAAALAAVAGEGHGLVMRDNVVLGTAGTAVQVGIGVAEVDVPWLVIGNDFGGFTARDVDVTVSSRARGAVVVCSGPTTVRDAGLDTVVACD
jgi:hypothetical protein